MKIGLILNNIGTPQSADPKDVKVYLDEFLMDPDVIGLPFPLRWLLVKGLITPRRSHQSAAKYQSVWMDEGSPLMVYSQQFCDGVQRQLGPQWIVRLGMRYGQPSLQQALNEMHSEKVERDIVAPLFPQFAEATTGSAFKETQKLLRKMNWAVKLEMLPPFYNQAAFLDPQAQVMRTDIEGADHVLFSFHGLPESQVRQNPGCLQTADCCSRPQACAMNCYRAQCVKTAQELAAKLNLPTEKWSLSFQSRLGPAKWIGPATDEKLKELGTQGVKTLAVACPAFVADCLETLEEIGLEGKKEFLNAGGSEYRLIPCLNADPDWVRQFADLVSRSRHKPSQMPQSAGPV